MLYFISLVLFLIVFGFIGGVILNICRLINKAFKGEDNARKIFLFILCLVPLIIWLIVDDSRQFDFKIKLENLHRDAFIYLVFGYFAIIGLFAYFGRFFRDNEKAHKILVFVLYLIPLIIWMLVLGDFEQAVIRMELYKLHKDAFLYITFGYFMIGGFLGFLLSKK